jgi:DNA segregation ATPase FtsK/SpoIIIE, S-DNA-T family
LFWNKSNKGNTKDRDKPVNDFINEKEYDIPNAKSSSIVERIKLLVKDERFRHVMGIFLCMLSVFVLISFTSYYYLLLTSRSDQALVISSAWDYLSTNQTILSQNIMGYLGAKVSYLFLFKWFGLISYIFPIILFSAGISLLTGKGILGKAFYIFAVFAGLWIPVSIQFTTGGFSLFLGGGIGYFVNLWLESLIGQIGTGLILVFSLLLYLIGQFNFRIDFWKPNTKEDESCPEINDFENLEEPLLSVNEVNTESSSFNHRIQLTKTGEDDKDEIDDAISHISFNVESNDKKELETQTKTKSENENDIKFEIEELPIDDLSEAAELNSKQTASHIGLNELYDPWLELSSYKFPTVDLFTDHEIQKTEVDRAELENSKNLIVDTLKNYNIGIAEIKATIGPTVTLYEIVPVSGVRISKIKNLEDDIALSLAALGIRIIAPIPGKGTIGIEVPNKKPEMVAMGAVIRSKKFQECEFELPFILGKTISNELYIGDLTKMPHLLVAGATGQGKSVGLNCLIVSLLYKKHPSELKFVMVDPKKVELSVYSKIENHFLAKLPGDGDSIITDTQQVTNTLKSLCIEMDLRYDLLKDAGCRKITEYNEKFKKRRLNPETHRFLPYIVCIIDEVADLMMTAGREVETPIARLAQLARAVGIHVILATQRPSVNIITGTIKANFPARLAFRVTSKIDSRTILDNNGADQLIGKGDMLFYSGSELIRLQCPFVDTPEVDEVTNFIGNQKSYGEPFMLPEVLEEGNGDNSLDTGDRDELYEEAARIVVENQQGSTSLIQRKLKIGYNRAGRLIDQLEMTGVVGSSKGSKARDVLIHDIETLERFLDEIG